MTDNYKQRYLDEMQTWQESDALLRKVVGRLAMASMGLSPSLDRLLKKIQGHARDADLTPLTADLDALIVELRALDAPVAAGSPSTRSDSADAPPGAQPARKTQTTPSEPASASVQLDSDSPTLAIGAGPSTTAGPDTPASTSSPADARELLLTLIEELVILQPGLVNLETLRESLQGRTPLDWRRALARVVAEVRSLIQRINGDKQALEQLMLEVSEELGDISHALGEDRGDIEDGADNAAGLQSLMDEGVAKIQTQIDQETDIQRLKVGVSESLSGIREGLATFMENDAERLKEALRRNDALAARVDRMEEESTQLREQISTHRRKLMHDALTGVGSRLAYDEMLAKELSRMRRYKEIFSLAIFDIDFFKRVNDTFGHAAGDKALQLVASIIDKRIRQADSLFRVGGEEFVLILPQTSASQAKPLVEAVRLAVGESGFHFDEQPVPITISAGLGEAQRDDDASTLFSRADEALYKAKKGGRNRVVLVS